VPATLRLWHAKSDEARRPRYATESEEEAGCRDIGETKGTDRLYYKPRRRAGRHVRERREFAIARRLATSSGKETQEAQATAWGAVQSGVTDGVALPQTQQPKQQQRQQRQQQQQHHEHAQHQAHQHQQLHPSKATVPAAAVGSEASILGTEVVAAQRAATASVNAPAAGATGGSATAAGLAGENSTSIVPKRSYYTKGPAQRQQQKQLQEQQQQQQQQRSLPSASAPSRQTQHPDLTKEPVVHSSQPVSRGAVARGTNAPTAAPCWEATSGTGLQPAAGVTALLGLQAAEAAPAGVAGTSGSASSSVWPRGSGQQTTAVDSDGIHVGEAVLVSGLVNAPQYNGCWGVVEAYDPDMQRYAVRVAPSTGGAAVLAKLRRETLSAAPLTSRTAELLAG